MVLVRDRNVLLAAWGDVGLASRACEPADKSLGTTPLLRLMSRRSVFVAYTSESGGVSYVDGDRPLRATAFVDFVGAGSGARIRYAVGSGKYRADLVACCYRKCIIRPCSITRNVWPSRCSKCARDSAMREGVAARSTVFGMRSESCFTGGRLAGRVYVIC